MLQVKSSLKMKVLTMNPTPTFCAHIMYHGTPHTNLHDFTNDDKSNFRKRGLTIIKIHNEVQLKKIK